ncbi:MAG: YoaP domain-containing protein [Clostridiales bacterium]|nr:YoaP domain-containing protein [Clostridiales bacterium]
MSDSEKDGRRGLCVLTSEKKRPFLADPKYLKYKGFSVCDEAAGGILLAYLPFGHGAPKPSFRECAKRPRVEEKGFVLYYTHQCPFNAKYVPIVEQTAKENGVPFRAVRIETKEQARNSPAPVTTYSLFYNGEFLTNEQMNGAKFLKLAGRLTEI